MASTQLSTVTDFLSLGEKIGFEVEGLFPPPRPPAFLDPRAVCRAKVGLEMVKHNGDSVRPEGPKRCSSLNSEETGVLVTPQGSQVHQQPEEIGVKNVAPNFLKWYFLLVEYFHFLLHQHWIPGVWPELLSQDHALLISNSTSKVSVFLHFLQFSKT